MNDDSQNHNNKSFEPQENAFIAHYSKVRTKKEKILEEPIAFPIMKRLLIIAIAFFIPIAGYIIYIVQRDDNPLEAKYAGISALIGFIGNLMLLALYIYSNNFFGNFS